MREEEQPIWDARVYAARAVARNKFCFALTELEMDDPFSAIIEYDGDFPQPWSRTDVPRDIYAIADVSDLGEKGSRYAALSNEGDVYWLGAQKLTEKIAGAGLLSPDASGAGILSDLVCFEDAIWAVGWAGQIYAKSGDASWVHIPFDIIDTPGFKTANLNTIGGTSSNDVYMCGTLIPKTVELDDQARMALDRNPQTSPEDWDAAFAAAERRSPDHPTEDAGRLFYWNGSSARLIDVPMAPNALLQTVFVEKTDLVWIAGTEGVLLKGNAARGFRRTGSFGSNVRFVSMTKYRDLYVIASEKNLLSFDGLRAGNFNPAPLRDEPLRPKMVQAIDDVLFYFDYISGIFRFDGSTWSQIPVPPGLYARNFEGLGTK